MLCVCRYLCIYICRYVYVNVNICLYNCICVYFVMFYCRGKILRENLSTLKLYNLWENNKAMQKVTPRSDWYRDVSATYIRRSEIPSRIYAKHQYRQESEYEIAWCFIHSNIWVRLQSYHRMWYNITRILHHLIGANVRIKRDIQ